jgi:hypothetical protein
VISPVLRGALNRHHWHQDRQSERKPKLGISCQVFPVRVFLIETRGVTTHASSAATELLAIARLCAAAFVQDGNTPVVPLNRPG